MIGRAVPKSDPAARNWALRRVLAGRHGRSRRIVANQSGARRELELPAKATVARDPEPVTFRRLEGGVGYIRFNDSLGDGATVGEFDRALAPPSREGFSAAGQHIAFLADEGQNYR